MLGCRPEWAERHPEQVGVTAARAISRGAVVRAAGESCRAGETAGAAALCRRAADLLHRALAGRLALTPAAEPAQLTNFYVPARHHATFPVGEPCPVVLCADAAVAAGGIAAEHIAAVRGTYRPDLYRAALAATRSRHSRPRT